LSETRTDWQTTVSKPVSYEGLGLHTGKPARVTLLPGEPDTGVCFERWDLPEPRTVKAVLDNIAGSRRATDLECNGVDVRTVEHILAAIVWSGIDNITVRLEGEELPLGDGSALTYVRLLEEAGLSALPAARRDAGVIRPVWVSEGDKHLIALPYEGTKVTFLFLRKGRSGEQGYPGCEYFDIEVTPKTFREEIAPARTIGFEWEIQTIQEKGLALGATLDQAVIVSEDGYVGSTRFPDEACRHKALDLLGDIAILGRIRGHFIGIGSGHSMNQELARLIACDLKPEAKRGVQTGSDD
jgi:UDP-3-O-[3-hydroxymyristoyl] N-acetylglucosamine deacetylase